MAGVRGALRAAAALAVLALAAAWGYPYLLHPVLALRLLREPPPAHLPVPVAGVVAEALADTWGAARSEGRVHEGVDIFAPRGTPVLAASEGIVVRKGWNRLGGRRLLVAGPAGWHHYYAHLEAFAGQELGDWVREGDVLGYVGSSGNAEGTPPHLHYGLYTWLGSAFNPYPLLAGDRRSPQSAPPLRRSAPSPRLAPGVAPPGRLRDRAVPGKCRNCKWAGAGR